MTKLERIRLNAEEKYKNDFQSNPQNRASVKRLSFGSFHDVVEAYIDRVPYPLVPIFGTTSM